MSGTNFPLFLLAALIIAAVPAPASFTSRQGRWRAAEGGYRVDVRDGAGRARACDRGRTWRLGDHSCKRAAVHRAEIGGRALSDLAWHQDVSRGPALAPEQIAPVGAKRAFRDGVLVEALNPKMAAFFLAFIPQFIDPAGDYPALQFMALGLISVALNTLVDIVVVMWQRARRAPISMRRPSLFQRLAAGLAAMLACAGLGGFPRCALAQDGRRRS